MTDQDAPREWDATAYDALPLPHERWAGGVLGPLALRGDERVLDVGAGTGRDTATLLERLPRGHVVAVDASTAMLARLRERLADAADDRLTVVRTDLRDPLVLDRPVDVVVSVATFHWLPDHPALFASLAGVLRPGGLLRAEWGGAGNLDALDAAVVRAGHEAVADALTFASAQETERALLDAGFVDVQVALVPDPAVLEPGEQLEAFLGTVVLGTVLDPLPPEERAGVVRAVARELDEPVVDYVRLQVSARLPEPPG